MAVLVDPGAQQAVVRALADLRAPFRRVRVFGNHEAWSGTKGSISTLFAAVRIRILRDECSAIYHAGEQLNLIGIEPDYGWAPSAIPNDVIWQAGVNDGTRMRLSVAATCEFPEEFEGN
jgi:hypothetical protein